MRSTVTRRPPVGLVTHFHAVTGSGPVTRLPVSVSPNPQCPGLGRTGHFRPERPLPRSERNYPHCATASWSWLAPTTSSKQGGGSPSCEGLAYPEVWHSRIGRGATDVNGPPLAAAPLESLSMRSHRTENTVIQDHGVTARPISP